MLTETADGEVLSDAAPDLRALLREEADRLVEEAIRQVMPAVERRLRDDMEELCREHIDRLLEEHASFKR